MTAVVKAAEETTQVVETDVRYKHTSLAEALAAFQSEDVALVKDKTAEVVSKRTGGKYSYSYVDLGTILATVRPLLAKHGLSWSAKPSMEGDTLVLQYSLLHESGDSDGDCMPLGVPLGCAPQELGSAITYARRYAITAQLNLAADEDDDGGTAEQAERQRTRPQAQPASASGERPANAAQKGKLNGRAAAAQLDHVGYANAMLRAMGKDPIEVDGDDPARMARAQQWVNMNLDRLPARMVTPVLEEIKRSAIANGVDVSGKEWQ